MALAHRVYLAYPSFRCHPHRWSSRPIASNSSNRISTRAVAATPVAIYIVGPFLLRSIVLLRHRARKGRCAQDDRVRSALAGCLSRASGPPLKLIAIQRSDCTSDPPNFVSHGSSLLITLSIFFSVSRISICHLSRMDQYCTPGPPFTHSYVISCSKLLQCVMHTRILQTRSRAFFFSVVITVVTIKRPPRSVSQSVSFFFFFASSHCALAFSVFTAIRQSKPYTATFFYSIVWCIAIFFLQYPSF